MAASQYDPDNPQHRAILNRVAWRLVPLLAAMYSMAYLDRINIGSAALTMNADLGISPSVFGLATSVFLVGYLVLEIPSNLLFVRFGARIWLTRIMLTWGAISAATAFIQSPTQLVIARILLGIAEAGFFPGMILYLAMWFPKEVRGRMFFLTTLPFAVIVGAPASTALIQYTDGWFGIAGWRIMFFVEGLLPIALGLITARYLTSKPSEATWLPERDRQWLSSVVEVSGSEKHSVLASLKLVFGNAQLALFALAYGLLQMGFYAQLIFTPQIIAAFGATFQVSLSVVQIGLLTAIPSVIGTIANYFWARHSDRTNERIWHATVGAAICSSGVILCVASKNVVVLLAGLTMLQGGLMFALVPLWQLPTRGLSTSAAAVVIAVVNSVGIVGSFISPLVIGWLRERTGSFDSGLIFIAAMLALAGLCIVVGGTVFERRRLERERLLGLNILSTGEPS